jgi:Predicted unusual protein kinase
VAAGSLGQFYRARLAGAGHTVAVKVQRADIRNTISADL